MFTTLLAIHHFLQRDQLDEKVNSVVSAVVRATEERCHCEFTAGHIDNTVSGFRCSSSQQNQVVFRSKLYGTKDTNASTLTSYISQWTSSDISITVLNLILDIDSTCPVHISSLRDPECEFVEIRPFSTEAVVAGVVVSVVILTISVTFVVAVVLIKRWRTSFNLKVQSRR